MVDDLVIHQKRKQRLKETLHKFSDLFGGVLGELNVKILTSL